MLHQAYRLGLGGPHVHLMPPLTLYLRDFCFHPPEGDLQILIVCTGLCVGELVLLSQVTFGPNQFGGAGVDLTPNHKLGQIRPRNRGPEQV